MSGNAWLDLERNRANAWRRYIKWRRWERRDAKVSIPIYCPLTDDDLEGLLDRLDLAEAALQQIIDDHSLTRAGARHVAQRALRWRWRKRKPIAPAHRATA